MKIGRKKVTLPGNDISSISSSQLRAPSLMARQDEAALVFSRGMIIRIATALILFSTLTLAQVIPGPSASPEEQKQGLMRLYDQLMKANLNCALKFFDQIEADEFIFTGADQAGDHQG